MFYAKCFFLMRGVEEEEEERKGKRIDDQIPIKCLYSRSPFHPPTQKDIPTFFYFIMRTIA